MMIPGKVLSDFLQSQNETTFLELVASKLCSKYPQDDIPSKVFLVFVYHHHTRSFEMDICDELPDTINDTYSLSHVEEHDGGGLHHITSHNQNDAVYDQTALVALVISLDGNISQVSDRIRLHLLELCSTLLDRSSAYTLSLSGVETIQIYFHPYLDLPVFIPELPALRSKVADHIASVCELLGEIIPDFVIQEYDPSEYKSPALLGSSTSLGFYFKWTRLSQEHFLLYTVKYLDPTLTLAELPDHLETDPGIVETTIGRRVKLASQFFDELASTCGLSRHGKRLLNKHTC